MHFVHSFCVETFLSWYSKKLFKIGNFFFFGGGIFDFLEKKVYNIDHIISRSTAANPI